jgi:integrase
MEACLKAHEHITELIGYNSLNKADLRANVLRYATLDPKDRHELIKGLILGLYAQQPIVAVSKPAEDANKPKPCPLGELLDKWLEKKAVENPSPRQAHVMQRHKITLVAFFKANALLTTDDFKPDTAHKFIAWRNKTSYGNNSNQEASSASTVKKDLDCLKQLGRLSAIHGYTSNDHIWDDVKIKAIVGVNKKVVKPLDIESQLELLNKLKGTKHHDVALLLLVTGMRLGELETLTPNSIQNGILTLNGDDVGNDKTTGKTASACRTLPVCPVLAKLFDRGNIFKVSRNAFVCELKRNTEGVHAHRLRHSFAVNNLLAQKPLQMVSYQIGHADIGMTANLYGKFVPEHFKAGFEETILIRKAHLQWLENDSPL